jgi:hypothetical protein
MRGKYWVELVDLTVQFGTQYTKSSGCALKTMPMFSACAVHLGEHTCNRGTILTAYYSQTAEARKIWMENASSVFHKWFEYAPAS